MNIPRLPDAELIIMQIIWRSGSEVTSMHICNELKGKKDWALTTVLNFLARLTERGFLTIRKSGKSNLYSPIISENDYLEAESKSFLERLHGNSIKSLMASLYSGDAVTQEELEELSRYIHEMAGEKK